MLQVRPATPADVPSLAQLFLQSRIQAFSWCPPHSFHLEDFERETQDEVLFVAHDSDYRPLGFISIWTPDSFIHHLFVDPAHQRKGIGSLLLGSLDSWLARPYRLKCLVANVPALAFYLSQGWKELSRNSDAHGEYALMELI